MVFLFEIKTHLGDEVGDELRKLYESGSESLFLN